jgi:hypothetical protein
MRNGRPVPHSFALERVAWASYTDDPGTLCPFSDKGRSCHGYAVALPSEKDARLYFCLRCKKVHGG